MVEAAAQQRCAARLDVQRQPSSSIRCSASRPQVQYSHRQAASFGNVQLVTQSRRSGSRRTQSRGTLLCRRSSVHVMALDASWPSDYETQAKKKIDQDRMAADKLKIGESGIPAARSKPLLRKVVSEWRHPGLRCVITCTSACNLASQCPVRHSGLRKLWAVPCKAIHQAGT